MWEAILVQILRLHMQSTSSCIEVFIKPNNLYSFFILRLHSGPLDGSPQGKWHNPHIADDGSSRVRDQVEVVAPVHGTVHILQVTCYVATHCYSEYLEKYILILISNGL